MLNLRAQAEPTDARRKRRACGVGFWQGLLLAAAGATATLPACGTEFEAAPDGASAGTSGSAGEGDPTGGSSGSSAAGRGGTSGSGGSGGSANAHAGEGGSAGTETGEGGSDGPGAGGGGGESAVPSCDPAALSEGCALEENAGLFVSPSGDDDASGSRTRPLRTITEAVERVRALSEPRPIFVCSTDYDENVIVRGDGVALHGGFACPSSVGAEWRFDSSARARIAPTSEGPALRVRDVDGFTLTNFVVQSRDADVPDESSVAAFVSGSDRVLFRSTQLISGRGGDGSPGALEPAEYAEQSALAGNAAVGAVGGAMRTCSCDAPAASVPRGGKGGDGGLSPTAGSAGYPLGSGGGGGQVQQCTSGGKGGNGTDTDVGANGSGADALGSITTSGWIPEAGESGEHGLPGQGGGGGGGALGASDGGGGSGACGGCGGRAAEGGRGGGASIGLLSLDSSITLESSSIQSGPAGDGGAGGLGQIGQAGGLGGLPSGNGCPGGAGGKGGDGAASGGGAGGLSAGIVWSGGEPELTDTDIDFDEAGLGGVGGLPGENDGIPGIARRIHAAL